MREEMASWRIVEWIYRKYGQLLWLTAARIVGEAEAEDMVQEVILEMLGCSEQFEGRADQEICGFAVKMVKNHCYDHNRKAEQQNESMESIGEKGYTGWKTAGGDPTERVAEGELAQLLKRTIHKLTPENRVVIECRARYNLSNQEIAELLHLSRATVDQRMCRGRKEIRRVLSGVGYYV